MAEMINVVIGIQARSTSRRFPRKVFEEIDGKPMIKHVMDACERAARYTNNHTHKTRLMVQVALLVPFKDELCEAYRRRAIVIEGPEDDVLSRYRQAAERLSADYIVRVTGDCPLIPPFLITKHIKTAVINQYDYLSNVDESGRTAADGTDCEVISAKLLGWLDQTAKDPKDREHVTTLARRERPEWAKTGQIIGHLNLLSLKLSVDSYDDLERVRVEHERVKLALENAETKHGKQNVHRF